MTARRAGRGTRRLRAARGGQGEPAEQHAPEARFDRAPGAHVLGLLLDPDGGSAVFEVLDGGVQVHVGQRVELLEADNLDILATELRTALFEVVVNLARAEEHARGALL